MDDDERPTAALAAQDPAPPDEEPPPRETTRIGPGADIGGYILEGEIGKGGMGYVYSATHPLIGKRAAVKVLKPDVSRSPIVIERFIQEARAVNQIGHPNIVDIFAFGKLPDGRAYHIMDLLVGESLRRRLRKGPLHPSEAAAVVDQIADALIAAHDKGFVHRDLKPDNVFLVERAGQWPEVKLLDFGLAKLMPEAGTAPFRTKTGVMLGTPEYMSPEQARGIGVDYRTDIYALGVLTFEILAGVRPFPSLGDSIATLQAHAEEPPPSLADLVPTLPAELVQLVAVMLAKDPAARPSLPAIRMVLKRLRTTLPTRTAAGMEALEPPDMAPHPPAPSPLDAVRPSRLGAAPVLPGDLDSLAEPPPPVVVPRTMTPARLSNPAQPLPPRSASPSQPPTAPPGPQVAPGAQPQPGRASTNPPVVQPPAASTHGRGSGSNPSLRVVPPPSAIVGGVPAPYPIAPSAPLQIIGPDSGPGLSGPQSAQPVPSAPGMSGQLPGQPVPSAVPQPPQLPAANPAAAQGSGLAAPGATPIIGTVLGVGVPNLAKPPGRATSAAGPAGSSTSASAAASPSASGRSPAVSGSIDEEPRASKLWLILGALLFIGAGVAIAIALM